MIALSVSICIITCVVMILGVLIFPTIKLGKIKLASYWVITLLGAALLVVILLIANEIDIQAVGNALIANTAINPIKILVLFLSMTILSIFLDELKFFRYLASATLKRAKSGQIKLFLYLYLIVSVLTVFTSNDVIILSFTPFICYFAKNAKINPTPYLAAEFVAANTWSMALIIGNPTNIYLATANGIDFLSYLKVSILPTLAAGIVAFIALFLLYRKKLSDPIDGEAEEVVIEDKFLFWVGIVHLAVCTILLAIGSYIGLEMWIVALSAVGSLFLFTLITSAVRKTPPVQLWKCLKRTPFQLVPFVLSMFVMIVVLDQKGVTQSLASFLGTDAQVWVYGASSFLFANIINNIPMSVLFSSIIGALPAGVSAIPAVYATVVGSNIGAFFTPIGALAGIMWSSILNSHGIKFGYKDFLKIGVTIALPTLAAALGMLWIVTTFII